ncbi:endonuclease III [Candidatus Uhrbacteria bacterium]|nr:MAG: endonuclease III [Candidatus Uhrbacteria bacterium]
MNVARVLGVLGKRYHGPGDTHLGTPEDTLLATLLSARSTDKQTLAAFPAFRKRFPDWESLAHADWREIAKSIDTIGLYRQKARAINKLAKLILDEFGGRVPSTMEGLTRLPGVGRKTASVVLTACFGTPAIAVDTHVFRITHRLGWTKGKNPKRVERELMELVPKRLWSEINRVMVPFGRDVCRAPVPQCWRCPVAKWCAYPNKTKLPVHR